MKFIFQFFSNNTASEKKTTWIAMLIIALCVFLQYVLNAEHVNRDGVLYIFQAQALTEGDANLARNLYPSIVFAQCIAWLHQLLSIPLAAAAHLIGFIFFMISSIFFLKTLTVISKDRSLLICGSIVILTSLALDKYVVMILRDHGLWAGLMMSTYFTVKFLDDSKWIYLLLSLLAITVAALFRVEALSLIPVILGFMLWKLYRESNLKPFKNAVTMIVVLMILGLIYFNGGTSPFSRYDHMWQLLTQSILNIFQPLPITTRDQWLSELLKDYPRLLKFGFFVSLVTYKWLSAVGLIFLVLFLIGIKSKKIKITPPVRYFLYCVGSLTLVWPVMNLFSVNVLTSRYLVPHMWMVTFFVTLGLYQVLFGLKDKEIKFKKLLQLFIFLALLVKFIDVMVDQRKPSLDQRIAQWALENQILQEESFVTNLRIRYYMNWLSLPTQTLKTAIKDTKVNYLILDSALSDKDETSFDILHPLDELKTNPRLFIYQRK
ncbi:MAG: hypothetical protein VW058_08150 [Flavobacteriaceae bacterium]